MTAQARDFPCREWINTLSPCSMAYSIKEKIALTALFFLSKILNISLPYILLFLGPVHRQILHPKSFVQVWHHLGDGIDYMRDFIGNDKFDILYSGSLVPWLPVGLPGKARLLS